MEPIGGYFGLELPSHKEYHTGALRLNTGRNCLEYILRAKQYKKVFIPYYTCAVILEPFQKLDIEYEYYHIDFNFEIAQEIILHDGEALLYTNYYGLKQHFVDDLAKQFGSQLIVDNTQAFYAKPIPGIDTFYTCRKFFGVPDGAYLYTDTYFEFDIEQDVSYNRMSFLLKRLDIGAEAGYADFRQQSDNLFGQPIRRMSNLTQRMMQGINYQEIAKTRRDNYIFLHNHLAGTNKFNMLLPEDAVPMVYPYLTNDELLKKRLISDKIFVATYWPNVLEWCNDNDCEFFLAKNCVFLPIDQRYDKTDMMLIINHINI